MLPDLCIHSDNCKVFFWKVHLVQKLEKRRTWFQSVVELKFFTKQKMGCQIFIQTQVSLSNLRLKNSVETDISSNIDKKIFFLAKPSTIGHKYFISLFYGYCLLFRWWWSNGKKNNLHKLLHRWNLNVIWYDGYVEHRKIPLEN